MRTFQAIGENTFEVVDRPVEFIMAGDARVEKPEDDYLVARINDNYTLSRLNDALIFEKQD